MSFNCSAGYSTLTQHRIGPVQGALFCHVACGNPSGLICSEASFFWTPELHELARWCLQAVRQADSEIRAPRSYPSHIL